MEAELNRERLPIHKSFGRSQVASIIATIVDFSTLVCLVELAHVWYVAATAIGATCGAITNFVIGRHWSFEANHKPVQGQALRYAAVSGISLVLNSAGVYLITEHGHLPYPVSKLITAAMVGIFFNFPLQRGFVFR